MNLVNLKSERIILFMPNIDDFENVLAYWQRNKEYLSAYSPNFGDEFYTDAFWKERLDIYIKEFEADTSVRLFMKLDGSAKVLEKLGFQIE